MGRLRTPHWNNEGYKRIRDGWAAMRKARGASNREELRKAYKSLEGVDVRGVDGLRKELDGRMGDLKNKYELNRLLSEEGEHYGQEQEQ